MKRMHGRAGGAVEGRLRLAHGNGGPLLRELLAEVAGALGAAGPGAALGLDAAPVGPVPAQGELLLTTDAFTVHPYRFPGGDLGRLAAHGTLNDLAVAGADPVALTLDVVAAEGLPLAELREMLGSLGRAARAQGVRVLAGDTKVVGHGELGPGGLLLATTGLGLRPPGVTLDPRAPRPGDRVLVSGPVGDHGAAVLLAREAFGLSGAHPSDCACVLPLAREARELPGVRVLRDPTRGGLASCCHELAGACGLGLRLEEAAVPVAAPVRALCQLLGYEPWHLACEGRVVAVAAPEAAGELLARWRGLPLGREAACIGEVVAEAEAPVVLATAAGGERVLEELGDEPLPRIC